MTASDVFADRRRTACLDGFQILLDQCHLPLPDLLGKSTPSLEGLPILPRSYHNKAGHRRHLTHLTLMEHRRTDGLRFSYISMVFVMASQQGASYLYIVILTHGCVHLATSTGHVFVRH